MGEITIQLERWRAGDQSALAGLTPLVYHQLRSLARSYAGKPGAGRLQATELVDQLFVELLSAHRVEFNDRRHFFAFSARVMRQILIHEARSAATGKRGGGRAILPLENELLWADAAPSDPHLLDLDGALEELEQLDETCVRVIEFRYFFGFTAEETADLLEISKSTADRYVRFGLTWLHSRLHPEA